MKQINFFCLSVMQNNEHHHFHSVVLGLMMTNAKVGLKLPALVTKYQIAADYEDIVMQKCRKNANTETVVIANEYRGKLDRSLRFRTKAALLESDSGVRNAGAAVMEVLNRYGVLRGLNFAVKSSKMRLRNNELMSQHATSLAIMGVQELVESMNEANSEFDGWFGTRAASKIMEEPGTVQSKRLVMDGIYEEFVLQINALTVVEGEADYVDTIDQLNYYTAYYRDVVNRRKALARIRAEEEVDGPVLMPPPPVEPEVPEED